MMDTFVIGIGNENRGDDGAGLFAAREIREMVPVGIYVLEMGADPAKLIDVWRGARRAYVIDCSAPAGVPGAIRRFAPDHRPLPSIFSAVSSHDFGLGAAIELARAMGCLPQRLIVYAIEGGRFDRGSPPQDAVLQAAVVVARAVCEELNENCPPYNGTAR